MKTMQNPAGFRTVSTGPAAMNLKTKTGHFICYQNRTFSFATDIVGNADVGDAG